MFFNLSKVLGMNFIKLHLGTEYHYLNLQSNRRVRVQTLLRLISKPYFNIYVALDTKVLSNIYFDYAYIFFYLCFCVNKQAFCSVIYASRNSSSVDFLSFTISIAVAWLAIIFACVVLLFITFLSVLVPLMVVPTCNLWEQSISSLYGFAGFVVFMLEDL